MIDPGYHHLPECRHRCHPSAFNGGILMPGKWIPRALLAIALSFCPVALSEPKAPATAPAVGSLQEGWEQIDQRLVFLTVQLSTVESSLDAVNKAIRANGYEKTTKQSQAEQARKGNAQMARNGGGPVLGSQFYGKTAQGFFY